MSLLPSQNFRSPAALARFFLITLLFTLPNYLNQIYLAMTLPPGATELSPGALGLQMVCSILALLGQIWVVFIALGQTGVPALVWYLPSGWGLLAVRGDWWALGALVGLIVLLLLAWSALLRRRAMRRLFAQTRELRSISQTEL